MRGWITAAACAALTLGAGGSAQAATISDAELRDRIHGAWVGGVTAAAWGAPVEFRFTGRVVPRRAVPRFSMPRVNRFSYGDRDGPDETYVELPFLRALAHTPYAGWPEWGRAFRRSRFFLFPQGRTARRNLRRGLPPPLSGDPVRNRFAHNIGWQMSSDFAGLVAPGQPGVAADISWRAGHVVAYGDGVLGGVMVAAMNAEAFRADRVAEIVAAGRAAVPRGTPYRAMIEDVIRWHRRHPRSWRATWRRLERRWNRHRPIVKRDPRYVHSEFNIDAKLNGGYVLLALLYGRGAYARSVRLAIRAGQDTDCNPGNVGSILGAFHGFRALPDRFTDRLRHGRNFPGTSTTLSEAIEDTYTAARGVVRARGGVAGPPVWTIPESEPPSLIAERWPLRRDRLPRLTATVEVTGQTARFVAGARDPDGIRGYRWSFGDLTGARGPSPAHTYTDPGSYRAIVWASDRLGRTRARTVRVVIP